MDYYNNDPRVRSVIVFGSIGRGNWDANRPGSLTPLSQLLDRFVRDAAVANVGCLRHQIWATVEILQRMRSLLMEIFTRTHGGVRGYQTFELLAEPHI